MIRSDIGSALDRRIVLGVVLAATIPACGVTQLIVNRYRDQRQRLALEWSARGQQRLAAEPAAAVTDFLTALSYGDRTSDRFLLAKALVGTGRRAEARAQLAPL